MAAFEDRFSALEFSRKFYREAGLAGAVFYPQPTADAAGQMEWTPSVGRNFREQSTGG